MNEKTPNWIKSKKLELHTRIAKFANKITWLTDEIHRFSPALRKARKFGSKGTFEYRSKAVKQWYKMAKVSLMSTRKKIYRLQEELKAL